jgi:maltooligosyltrehalose synthase
MRVSMSSELNVLARRLDRICQQHRHTRDFTLDSLRFALREIISCFPVYRTYIREDQTEVDEEDRRHIEVAISEACAPECRREHIRVRCDRRYPAAAASRTRLLVNRKRNDVCS